ncbi:hypothetical protein AAFF_G00054100 [Aldrovandia affinis]|uniref:Uncharacterized protein n=1 Tax=Aldrovandia affinis TaxID=143900 RepID=A0AAD7S139_9TELE|nr:hypothetical protein AAFF_G00054100 [Aldrovandia affinis]
MRASYCCGWRLFTKERVIVRLRSSGKPVKIRTTLEFIKPSPFFVYLEQTNSQRSCEVSKIAQHKVLTIKIPLQQVMYQRYEPGTEKSYKDD